MFVNAVESNMNPTDDLITLTPGTNTLKANEVLLKLETALNNKKISGLLLMDVEVESLLKYVLDLQSEVISLRETYEG